MKSPLFSIITVTYNANSTIGRTLISITSQTFEDYEHIVVDGASTDDTLKWFECAPGAAKRTIISEPDKGLYDAMNKGIGLARGKYLIFLNAGDKFHSHETLNEIAEAIAANDEADIIYGQTVLVDNEGFFVAPRHLTAPPQLSYKDFAKGMLVCHQAFVARREIAPYFNLKYKYSADFEWCIICLMHSKLNVYIDDVLIDYLSKGLTTSHHKSSLKERFKIMSTYYGFYPTLFRHVGFIFRFLKRKHVHL